VNRAAAEFSKDWKNFPAYFQGLENFTVYFSKAWKNAAENFQALETGVVAA
jgi:hypothetical protein